MAKVSGHINFVTKTKVKISFVYDSNYKNNFKNSSKKLKQEIVEIEQEILDKMEGKSKLSLSRKTRCRSLFGNKNKSALIPWPLPFPSSESCHHCSRRNQKRIASQTKLKL